MLSSVYLQILIVSLKSSLNFANLQSSEKYAGCPLFLCPISKFFLYILVSSFKKGRRFAKSGGKWEALNDNDFTELCLLTPMKFI